jgi:hypothetical protein
MLWASKSANSVGINKAVGEFHGHTSGKYESMKLLLRRKKFIFFVHFCDCASNLKKFHNLCRYFHFEGEFNAVFMTSAAK